MKIFWWNRRPMPKFREADVAVIVDRKVARYLTIMKRWWDARDKDWMYEGTVLIIKDGVLEFVARDHLYSESDLIRIRGL